MYTLYTTNDYCEYCEASKKLLFNSNIEFLNIILDTTEKKQDFKESTGLKTVPQVYHSSGELIGGHDDLVKFLSEK